LIVGGHVDPSPGVESLLPLFTTTLRRELHEELGIQDPPVTRVGIIIDPTSVDGSRHVGFVYEVSVTCDSLNNLAPEEFSSESHITGEFFTRHELQKFHTSFDPWSLILFERYIYNPPYFRRWPKQIGIPGLR
jgi:predicted NUDIX family phosphoesterase